MAKALEIRKTSASPAPFRPPWTTEGRVRSFCTGCGDCISACPEAILTRGRAGAPILHLNGGACTFCGDCAEACDEAVFDDTSTKPWNIAASLTAGCLLDLGVTCQSCTDACDVSALRFDHGAGRVGAIIVDANGCTGCGACLGVCPTGAIALAPKSKERAA